MRIAVLGTRGVPANYGGFETCAEEVSVGLVERGHDVTVYCRRGNASGDPAQYKGVRLRYPPHIERKSLGTLTHTLAATWDAMRQRFDVLLYFNAATAPAALLAKLARRAPVVLNVDGLEWRRRKWGPVGRTYYVVAEWLSTKVADRVISDSMAIQRYYVERWKTPSTFVPYGARVEGAERPEILREYGLEPGSYFFVASRLEPENNADLTVDAFARVATDKRLVIAGAANYRSRFVEELRRRADPRVMFLGPVYRPGHIRELHCGALAYVHGNEVGGTNPALLKALGYGNCVLALDVPFNAEVVGDAALLYRKDADHLAAVMRRVLAEPDLARRLGERARQRIRETYQWEHVVAGYEQVLERAVAGEYRAAALVGSTQGGKSSG
jgi:glycosyltransferase involved in cell wall biosynthesis